MPLYRKFYPETITIIKETLSFVKSAKKKATVDRAHHDVIDKEIGEIFERIDRVKLILNQKTEGLFYRMDAHFSRIKQVNHDFAVLRSQEHVHKG